MIICQVDGFYNFWFEFKSWRDFSARPPAAALILNSNLTLTLNLTLNSASDEYDLEDAGDRFERRLGLGLGLDEDCFEGR